MSWTRRRFVLASLGLLAAGCAERSSRLIATSGSTRPGPVWPTPVARPQPSASPISLPAEPIAPAAPPLPPATASGPPVAQRLGSLAILPRRQWTGQMPIAGRVQSMARISRVTVHHEGHTPVDFADLRATTLRLQQIHHAHVKQRGWGDIGYHYVIDRAGRIWEARPLGWQGAHVAGHNEENLGVVLLGNFDRQSPSEAQLASLRHALTAWRQMYRLPVEHIHTHQEFTPTACPGRMLQPRMVAMRQGGYLG